MQFSIPSDMLSRVFAIWSCPLPIFCQFWLQSFSQRTFAHSYFFNILIKAFTWWRLELSSSKSFNQNIEEIRVGECALAERLESELAKYGQGTGSDGKDSWKHIWRNRKLHSTKYRSTNYLLQYLNHYFPNKLK